MTTAHAPVVVADEAWASRKRVAFVPKKNVSKAGRVVDGQYDVLAPGCYLANFRPKVLRLQVRSWPPSWTSVGDNGQRILAKLPAMGDQIKG